MSHRIVSLTRRLGHAVWVALGWLGGLLRALSGFSWAPPRWMLCAGHGAAQTWRAAKARPGRSLAGVLGLAVVAAGAWLGWDWYRNQPLPQTVAYRWEAPGLADYQVQPPRPGVLSVRFDASVAPLQAIGKPVRTGVELSPALDGRWHWASDKQLVFTPDGDWAIGQRYRVRMDKKTLFAAGILLDQYGFEFQAPPFGAEIVRQELYQDPVSPDLKSMLARIRFTHPVDAASLAERVQFSLGAGLQYREAGKDHAPEVRFDEHGLNAYVQSAALAMPLETVPIRMEVAAGVKPRAPGEPVAQALAAQVAVPGRYQLGFNPAQIQFADNVRGEPEPVLLFGSTRAVADQAIAGQVRAWLLPEREQPWTKDEVDEQLLSRASDVPLTHVPSAEPLNSQHAFKFNAPPGRFLYVRVARGVEGVGGYLSRDGAATLLRMPDYPKVMRFLSEGALLALGGEQRLGFLARGVAGVQVEVARLLPEQLHHLVDQHTGTMARPGMAERYFDRLVEREIQEIAFAGDDPARTHYDAIDLGRYLRHDGGRKGVFVVRLGDLKSPPGATFVGGRYPGDTRFVIVTDLGIIAKRNAGGGQDVFVQSIEHGTPVPDAQVRIVGRNGLPVAQGRTDAQGHAYFPDLGQLQREKTPLMVLVSQGEDVSFLPLARGDQRLDFSRFDVGGVRDAGGNARLDAYLFTDRGLYRPGETAHMGMIVRRSDWQGELRGLPVELVVTDPRGMAVMRKPFRLSESGYETLDFASSEAAPAGTYMASLVLIGSQQRRVSLGNVEFSVRAFEPDRMKVDLSLSEAAPAGWLSPQQVRAKVKALHLFGAPASGRRVGAELSLSPAFADFRAWPGYRFHLRDGLSTDSREELAEAQTDDEGNAELALRLERFSARAYQLHLLARVFESEGGRSVAAEQRALVSSAPWLVGVKSEDALDYIPVGARRAVHWQAVAPDLSAVAVPGLRTRVVEHRYVSVLIKQSDGVYRYESRVKEIEHEAQPLSLPAEGAEQLLPTQAPGEFSLVLEDADGNRLNRIGYTVAGQGNVSRALDRNAELQLQLDKRSYAPGDEISVSIRAPYAGAGLITIERDKVYAHQWFKTDATSSVQTIRLPQGLEGNAYVNVQFVRDPGSSEIYMSPLSYGVAPFSIDLEARRLPVALSAPEHIEPGQTLTMTLDSARPARAVVYAVDEGILQVARYDTPDPLSYFFRKRALEVDTRQILDLILPEFSLLLNAAAPGGDSEADLASHLNPFKRKRKPPVAWWSGLIDVPQGATTLEYTVPDSFNGRLRLMAVSLDAQGVGVAESQTEVRGPLVITPNVPAFVAPGDVVQLSAGIYSNLEQDALVRYRLETSAGLSVAEDDVKGELSLSPRGERTAVFSVTARDTLGSAELRWVATLPDGREVAISETLSVRPGSTRRVSLLPGSFDGASQKLSPVRDLYPELSRRQLGLGSSPLVWAHGLRQYLDDYAYTCTEQMISRAMPGLILGQDEAMRQEAVDGAVRMLRQRQDSSGGFGMWASNLQVSVFASLYATDFLLEARERGMAVPGDLLEQANAYLAEVANGPSEGMAQLRERAYAAYLLTRQGVVAGRALADIQERMQQYHGDVWQSDLAAAYLAASYKLLKQDKQADAMFEATPWRAQAKDGQRQGAFYDPLIHDPLIHDAQRLTLLVRHFPSRAGKVPQAVLQAIGANLAGKRYNALSAALLLRALDAYGDRAGAGLTLSARAHVGDEALTLALQGKPPRADVPFGTRELELARQGDGPAFYLLSEAGFDHEKTLQPVDAGLEISREYLDLQGKPLAAARVGDEFLVRLRMRAVERDAVSQVAIVELLPGGIEPVINMAPQGEGEDEDGGERGDGWDAPLGEADWSDWMPEFADVRDDRLVLYGDVSREAASFVYRVRAVNAGTFTAPAPYAEGVYDTDLMARGAQGELRVLPPAGEAP